MVISKTIELEGQTLYWGKSYSRTMVLADKLRRVIDILIYVVLILIALGGLVILGWHVYACLATGLKIFSLKIWLDPVMRYWWWSLLIDMFIFYLYQSRRRGYTTVLQPGSIAQSNKKKYIDISRSFSKDCLRVFEAAFRIARLDQGSAIQSLHIFSALLANDDVKIILGRLGVDYSALAEMVQRTISGDNLVSPESQLNLDSGAEEVVLQSYVSAYEHRRLRVEVAEVLEAVVRVNEKVREILFDYEITQDKIDNAIAWIRIQHALQERYDRIRYQAGFKPKGAMNRGMTAIATPTLDAFSDDFTMLAKAGYFGLCVARDKVFSDLYQVLEGGGAPVLVGQPGVGIDTIIEGLANQMVAEEVPEFLQDKRLVSLHVSKLVAGTVHEGELEDRVMKIIYEVGRSGNIVLFISNVHNLVGVSSVGRSNVDLADILTESLMKRGINVIASSTPYDYIKYIEHSSFASSLTKIEVNEPTNNETIQILAANVGRIEAKNEVFFSYDALESAVTLSGRYVHDRFLPSKAIQIVEEAAVRVKNRRGRNQLVTGADVAALISEKAEVPLSEVTTDESAKLLHLEDEIHQRVVNQVEAVGVVASAIRRARAELRDIKRPIVNLLFLGPTGVGKTELAKTVAAVYFGNEERMIRLDMSEYQEQNSLQRLLGTPGGDEGGVLTNAVRQDPHSILLLDEIEKAHPDILNVFLQVMEDGRLTDVTGRTVDFTNLIFIATSNAGTNYIQDRTGQGATAEEIKNELLEKELRPNFRPEFLNRFDNIVVFKPLTEEHIEQIAALLLKKEQKRLEAKGIFLEIAPQAVTELSHLGYDPKFGARPLRRVIQEKVENALANYLLTGKLGRRDKVVLVSAEEIRVEKAVRL